MKKIYVHPTHLQNFRKKEDIVFLLTGCLNLDELKHSLEVLQMIKSGILDCHCWGICSNFKNMFGKTWVRWMRINKVRNALKSLST